MWERLACAALIGWSLSACQEVKGDAALVTGGGPVFVVGANYLSSGDSAPALGADAVTYIVAKLELTNDQALPIYPTITHFALIDRSGNRYFGIDSGAALLSGISNDLSPLRSGEKRTLTVAFRVVPTTMGTIRYDY